MEKESVAKKRNSGMSLKHRMRGAGVTFRSLSLTQKLSVVLLVVLLVALPLAMLMIVSPKTLLKPRANSETPVTPPVPTTIPSCQYCFKGVCDNVCHPKKDDQSLCPDCTGGPIPTSIPPGEANNVPVITTSTLKDARVGSKYSTSIEGYDQDINDGLSMAINNLPPGLSQGKCRSSKNRRDNVRELKCSIEGTPSSLPASYLVEVVLSDDKGGGAIKTLTLQVN